MHSQDPFASSQPQRSSQSLHKKEKTFYIKKTFSSYLFYIEPHMAHIKDPLALAMNFMPPNWHFIPKESPKSIKFYSNILKQEQSALVENIRDKKDPSLVLYHKLIIKRFIRCKEWEQHPSILRTLEGTVL